MAAKPDISWTGISGMGYGFWIYKIGKRFTADTVGVYIYARRTSKGYEAVYIGQGILNSRLDCHESQGCIKKKGATEIHCCSVGSLPLRRNMEKDLLAGHIEAYAPTGCNEKVDG
ncbi:hypothetical protein [Ruegeria atlantica]|uniref:hypothetical protein n=1 Tax=Ruegeria atlantica TaxID=81569 RepID=UPI00147ACAEA|nr:hypothetical protein [Ruegeria atlantica]